MKLPKVTVGLSGGVDSSVAALILKKAGFDVRGVYLKCYWTHEGCQSDLDRNSAARVAAILGIPFEVWDFEKEYKALVVEYFYAEYGKGRTPNPDVVCNREIKFGLFLRRALGGLGSVQRLTQGVPLLRTVDRSLNARFCPNPRPNEEKSKNTLFLATGHYARIGFKIQDSRLKIINAEGKWVLPKFCQADIVPDAEGIKFVEIREYLEEIIKFEAQNNKQAGIGGNFSIFGGEDERKDQSYFLYDISEPIIEHILYPLGNLTKPQVRMMAKAAGLPTADRPDSTGICFIGQINVEKFLKERIKEHEGEVVDTQGRLIGKHQGVEFYTIGQRHGFKITNLPAGKAGFQFLISNQNQSPKFQSQSGPLYVIAKDIKNNRLVVGAGEECKRDKFQILSSKLQTNHNYQNLKELNLYVRIRHLGELIPCRVKPALTTQRPLKESLYSEPQIGASTLAYAPSFASSAGLSEFEVRLEYPVFGVAPGQSAVFYRKFETRNSKSEIWQMIGGGVIAGDEGERVISYQ